MAGLAWPPEGFRDRNFPRIDPEKSARLVLHLASFFSFQKSDENKEFAELDAKKLKPACESIILRKVEPYAVFLVEKSLK